MKLVNLRTANGLRGHGCPPSNAKDSPPSREQNFPGSFRRYNAAGIVRLQFHDHESDPGYRSAESIADLYDHREFPTGQ